jgi:hypothetical protein
MCRRGAFREPKAFVSGKAGSNRAENHRYNIHRKIASSHTRVGGIRPNRLGASRKTRSYRQREGKENTFYYVYFFVFQPLHGFPIVCLSFFNAP